MEKNISKFHRKKPIKEFDTRQTLYSLVLDENRNNLQNVAIGYLGYDITYGQLFESVDKLANAYIKAGIKKDDVVAICTINSPVVQQNLLALNKIGAVSKWIDLRSKEKELIRNLNESDCRIVVIFDGLTPAFENILKETNVEKVLLSSPKDYLPFPIRKLAEWKDKKDGKVVSIEDTRFIKFMDFLNSGNNSPVLPAAFDKDKPTLIVQSSGSTGTPKSIVHTDYNFNASVQKLAYTDLPLYKGHTLYVAVPPFIIYGLSNSIYSAMVFEMKAEMTPYIEENTVYNDLGKFDVPFAAPLHYRYIQNKLKELLFKIEELSLKNSFKAKNELKEYMQEYGRVIKGLQRTTALVSGGDKISTEEIIDMQHAFDKVIVNGYGNNEVVGAAIVSPRFANKPGSIGIPMRGVEAAAFNVETNERLQEGEMGELCLCTDTAFVEYLGNSAETHKIKQLHSDGKYWIHTGDLAVIDKDGYIILKGRCRRIIYREAFKICPDTIENVIQKLLFVKNCVVVGVKDRTSKSVPMAFIEFESQYKGKMELLVEQIKVACKEALPDYELPAYYREIEKIPYTDNNKQDFRLLEELGNEYVSLTENI